MTEIDIRRTAMCTAGVLTCGFSVGLFKVSALGLDPFQAFMSGLNVVIPIRFGSLYLITNILLLLFALTFDRRKIGLATLINLFFLGYIVEFSQNLCIKIIGEASLPLRLFILVVGIIIMCLSASLYFTADQGVSTYDAVALIWSEKQNRIPFPVCRIICDLSCVILGILLSLIGGAPFRSILGAVNIGTVITAFFMGPLIHFFNIHVSRPLLRSRHQ